MPIGRPFQCVAGLALLALVGCSDVREQFLEGRTVDRCDGQWPVCAQVAGCLLGPQSYAEGRFPGSGQVVVQLFEPSTVRASFFLEELAASGEQTVLNFFEEGCRARVRIELTGKELVAEAADQGFVTRQADLSGLGDHLVSFESTSKSRYLLKVDVVPQRLQQ